MRRGGDEGRRARRSRQPELSRQSEYCETTTALRMTEGRVEAFEIKSRSASSTLSSQLGR